MGLFDKLFKAKSDAIVLGAAVDGEAVDLAEVSDPTFGEGILGKGVAIKPVGGTVYAPCDAEVDLMFETGHAVNLKGPEGLEILIHIGLETIGLKGEGFTCLKKNGDKVKKGEALINFDRALLLEKGFDIITPMVICNTDEYESVERVANGSVKAGDDVLAIRRK